MHHVVNLCVLCTVDGGAKGVRRSACTAWGGVRLIGVAILTEYFKCFKWEWVYMYYCLYLVREI